MGFRNGAYAMVSAGRDKDGNPTNPVDPKFPSLTKVRLFISRKDKRTDEYVTEFSGFADFVGTATAKKALGLKDKMRIKLGDVDVISRYDKDRGMTFTNYKVFSFEVQDGSSDSADPVAKAQANVDDGEVDDSRLPF